MESKFDRIPRKKIREYLYKSFLRQFDIMLWDSDKEFIYENGIENITNGLYDYIDWYYRNYLEHEDVTNYLRK